MGLFEKERYMRTFASLVLIFSLGFGAAASAQECTDVAYSRVADGYIYKDFGSVASDEPVIQGGITRTCGNWSYDVWASIGSNGGLANEVDGSVFYNTTAGPFTVQLSGQYYAVNLHDSLLDASDDMVELYADVSLPITRGRFTVAPLVRVIEVVGIDELPTQTLISPGARFSYQATSHLTVAVDLRESVNLTNGSSTFRFESSLGWQLSDRTSVRFGYEGTDRTRSVFSIGASHRF